MDCYDVFFNNDGKKMTTYFTYSPARILFPRSFNIMDLNGDGTYECTMQRPKFHTLLVLRIK